MFENKEKKYHIYSDYLKNRYGKKVFKVSLNGHFTCPNKDGSVATGGCIYCSPSGSGDFAGNVEDDLKTQFQQVKTMMHKKWQDAYYIAYFQANTNTYKDVKSLRNLFETAITLDKDIVGLSVGTRCDALDEEKVKLLAELNQSVDVQVELGLQSIHDETAKWMNRGHDLNCFDQAVALLRQYNLEVVVHIINGFPNEDKTKMLETIHHLNTLDIQGIKIHMLHIMKKTTLAYLYEQTPFHLLSLEEYVDIVKSQIEQLNPNIIVHRVTGDAPRSSLIAPLWTLKKFVVMNEIDKRMRSEQTYQGIYYKQKAL